MVRELWRRATTGCPVIFAAPAHDYRGRRDSHDYTLQASIEADADQLACAASLVCGKRARRPAARHTPR